MGSYSKKKIEFLVVDTSAFINKAALQDMGENILTVPQVINEVKSKRQLRRLVVLPYDLCVKEAFPENIKFVTEFSKKTGDYASLSATDINVIALTYQLEKEKNGVEHLKTAPVSKPVVAPTAYVPLDLKKIAGFYVPKKRSGSRTETVKSGDEASEYDSAEEDEQYESAEDGESGTLEVDSVINNVKLEALKINISDDVILQNVNNNKCINDSANKSDENLTYEKNGNEICEDDEENYDDEDDENCDDEDDENCDDEDDENCDDDDDEESDWITPSNVEKAKNQIASEFNADFENLKVACLTTDFAMQNVLKQIGLNVISIDGKLIKQLRTFILRCYGCFKTTSNMTKIFCPNCGNKTLKKVGVSVNPDGTQRLHINFRKPLTARGKRYSLPRFKGGKHSNNPILCEDQPMPEQRPSRLSRTKNNPLNDDYIAGYSPFVTRDVTSKSAMLGIKPHLEMKHWMRRNPNESRKKKK